MSELLEIQSQLQDTSEAIAKSEKAVASDPASASARAMLRSFEKRRQSLEAQFSAAASSIGTDICTYRFFSDDIRPTVTPLCNALIDFQSLYSLTYDAVKTGPKKRGRKPPQDVIEEASFFFGYTFSGSLGVVLTFDNSKVELFGTALDESMQVVAKLASAKSSADILACGRQVGVPTIRAVHKWASTHVASSLGAEIAWRKGDKLASALLMEPQSFADLAAIIATTTETIEENVDAEGRLLGADVKARTFHLLSDEIGEIKGYFASLISPAQTFDVGRSYKFTLNRKVKVYYSTDVEEDVTWQLMMAAVL